MIHHPHLMQVSEMIRIDTNSSFFSIRNNERTQGAWNDAQNLVKLNVVDIHNRLPKLIQYL